MTNQPPDCGTCTHRECPDHGQPHNMRTVLAEECIMRSEAGAQTTGGACNNYLRYADRLLVWHCANCEEQFTTLPFVAMCQKQNGLPCPFCRGVAYPVEHVRLEQP